MRRESRGRGYTIVKEDGENGVTLKDSTTGEFVKLRSKVDQLTTKVSQIDGIVKGLNVELGQLKKKATTESKKEINITEVGE